MSEFKRCGEGHNHCNCTNENECGYVNEFLDEEDSEYSTCERCKGDSMWTSCWSCGGEGGTDGEDLMSEDPLWYGPEDFRTCDICNGKGGYYVCLTKCQENKK